MSLDLEQLLPATVAIARTAGECILEIYDSDFEVETKADSSPLTAADMAAHHCIVERLAALTDDLPVLSEESANQIDYAHRKDWNPFWLVDPLDGTKEFVKRNGEFTVNIALIHDHDPVLGVVHVPVRGVTYFGARGTGAFRQDGNSEPRRIEVRECDSPPRIVGSRSHRSEALDAFLGRLSDYRLLSMGSSLKFCLVAEGSADLYPRLGPTSEWDTAAAQAVVECAGGTVTRLDRHPLRYNERETVLNPFFLVAGAEPPDWYQYFS